MMCLCVYVLQKIFSALFDPGAGVVLESTFDASKGSLATLLVQRGTLKKGDYAVSGTKFCRVRQGLLACWTFLYLRHWILY